MPIVAFFVSLSASRRADEASNALRQTRLRIADLERELSELKTRLSAALAGTGGVGAAAQTTPQAAPRAEAPLQVAQPSFRTAMPAPAVPPSTTASPVSSPTSRPPAVPTAPAQPTAPALVASTTTPSATQDVGRVGAAAGVSAGASAARAAQTPARSSGRAPTQPPPPSAAEQQLQHWLKAGREWLFGGNLVAKVGLLILFIGIAFLMRLASDYITVPIELRLAGVAAAAIALLIWGWKIRDKRSGIALPTQGAALAILMLVTFGSYRLFAVIPSGAAFVVLVALVAFTCLLAALQNAMWLAMFGIAGGFAAPILTSSGGGSHIALFTYYALLNAGILALALRTAWRPLNLLGFIFTFLIGTAWGVLRYEPQHYLSTQLFLVLFALFYLAIAVLYALRQAPQLKSYVDGTLVFGTPLAAMGLQYGLVKDMPLGMALSALTAGLVYAILTAALWHWRRGTLRLLVESFFALAVVFGTLAIPLAVDGRWTSAVWALEGSAIVWIGLRQRQALAWKFGLLVQVGSWAAFIAALKGIDALSALKGNLWLGFLLLGLTAVMLAWVFRKEQATESDAAKSAGSLAAIFVCAGVIWLLAGAWVEVWLRSDGISRATMLVLSALALVWLAQWFARRLQWALPAGLANIVFALAALVFVVLAWPHMDLGEGDYFATTLRDWLLEGSLIGGALLCAAALGSAVSFQGASRAHAAGAPQDVAGTANAWLLIAAFWWFGFVLPPLVQAVAWTSAQGGTTSASGARELPWWAVGFWTTYAVAAAASAWLWLQIALRGAFANRYLMITLFWPGVTAAAVLLFAVRMVDRVVLFRGAAFDTDTHWLIGLANGPLLGALLLATLCATAAMRVRRSERTEFLQMSADAKRNAELMWVLGFGVIWYVLVCDAVAAAVARWVATVPELHGLDLSFGTAYALCVLASAWVFSIFGARWQSSPLRTLAGAAWAVQVLVTVRLLATLYGSQELPGPALVAVGVCAWLVAAHLVRPWAASVREKKADAAASTATLWLKCAYMLRVAAPWLMVMPAVSLGTWQWLQGGGAQQSAELASAGWVVAGAWSDYLAAWVGFGLLFWLLRQAQHEDGSSQGWPLAPLQRWHRTLWIALGSGWGVLLVVYWNLRQDGTMAPLPYLPILNPLDITTGIATALVIALLHANSRESAAPWAAQWAALWQHRAKWGAACAFAWLNLMLLRTAAQYLSIPYRAETLFASQFVQAMLSLVWTATALACMWLASRRAARRVWMVGAVLLGVVVLKLFVVDLSNVGSVARVVSFIGVGVLMLAIGYLAPLPSGTAKPPTPATPQPSAAV
jgi:uncharacterized membrane protein